MARTEHKNMLGYQLPIILIGRCHIHLKTLFLGLMSKRSYHIVCLITIHLQNRNIHSLKQLFDSRYCPTYILWRLLSLRLILLKCLMTERRSRRVKRHSQMTGLHTLNQVLQRDYKTKNSRSILSARVHTRRTNKSIIRAINHRVSIYE